MSVTAVRTPAEFEAELQKYLFERAEEGRAVRVGEKEVSERAEIVARYRELFTREQLDALHEAESGADPEERERLYRLRKTCESGLVEVELSAREDELENAILAARVVYRGRSCRSGRPRRSSLSSTHSRSARSSASSTATPPPASTTSGWRCCRRERSSTRSFQARRTLSRETKRKRASRFASSRRC